MLRKLAECTERARALANKRLQSLNSQPVSQSTSCFLSGFSSGEVRKAIKDLAKEAEKESFWLWLRRNDKSWGAEKPQGIRT